ncbi:MAG: hypothetical protein KUA35_13835 [Pseudodesulfovibrio sp.]|uniref:Uncharacterized protein n=1 Tax=Pseudodesulfovibrio aespoeensis (strain ATCC 700646 / DSM 10631 / Aspo-2) TaxID=643562 RepID=E6VZ73_PSEA9|nr:MULTISPECIES: hypothetical protein [Pseudodesulfovibrio]MBU4190787.1 hypothetical protein [Pseudomonadota bacterium]ADU62849.1 hypothetical protein Daes_1837 [Pseudodesulfovibrio aespoeensis Aspo-2]MBU4243352.1 hypothetical protein [Pseudomonadota bacterium]MBU4380459.1 hypothetical protein [Pseudomonadota bacterium]MBU4474580.1 hypothetical protein [Pseudomonadota bacterium]
MSMTIDSTSLFPSGTTTVHKARGLIRTVSERALTMKPEKTEEELQLETSSIPTQRQLTHEEELRAQYLKNLLAQIMSMSEAQPTEEQKTRIRDIEKELEKITGVKMRSSLSNATEAMPAKTRQAEKAEEEEEKRKRERQMQGIDPLELKHMYRPDFSGAKDSESGTPMKMIRNAGAAAYQNALDSSSAGALLGDSPATGLSLLA